MSDLQLVNDRLEALISSLSALARQSAAEYQAPAGARRHAVQAPENAAGAQQKGTNKA